MTRRPDDYQQDYDRGSRSSSSRYGGEGGGYFGRSGYSSFGGRNDAEDEFRRGRGYEEERGGGGYSQRGYDGMDAQRRELSSWGGRGRGDDDGYERERFGSERYGGAGEYRSAGNYGGSTSYGRGSRDYGPHDGGAGDRGRESSYGGSRAYGPYDFESSDEYRRGDGSSRRGFADMDREHQRERSISGGRTSHERQGRDWSDDERSGYGYGRRSSSGLRGRGEYDDDRRDDRGDGSSWRGFASMDPERHRAISSMGGRASHGGQGRDWEPDDRGGNRGYWSLGQSQGGRNRSGNYDTDDEYRRGSGDGSSLRGFAAMDRELSSMGARASHGGRGSSSADEYRRGDGRSYSHSGSPSSRSRYDEDDDRRYSSSSRRGFASMDPERHREISSMGGRASHGGR